MTAQVTLEQPVATSGQLYRLAESLFHSRWKPGRTVRLIGVGLNEVRPSEKTRQEGLFDDALTATLGKQSKIEKVIVERMKRNPGQPGITKASLLGKDQGHQEK